MKVQGLELPAREAEQRVRRAQRGAEREELLAQLEELAAWYRDLVVVAVGAERAAVHVDRLDDAPRRRDARAHARRRARGRGRARDVAPARGVQPRAAARARVAVRRGLARAAQSERPRVGCRGMNYVVFVEIPGGSRNKYEWDDELGGIVLDRRLFTSMSYPADYGYIEGTLAEDGDPLDALVLVSDPTFPGCRIRVRPIGVFHMSDEKGPDEKMHLRAAQRPELGPRQRHPRRPGRACATRSSTSSRSTRTSTTRARWSRAASATARRPKTRIAAAKRRAAATVF